MSFETFSYIFIILKSFKLTLQANDCENSSVSMYFQASACEQERKRNLSHLAKEACKQRVSPYSFKRLEFQSLIIW